MAITRFNIRVYGIWIRSGNVLLSHEKNDKLSFTKFPGGGLEYGEGILDCLHREWREELGIDVISHELFYVNEDLVQSAFNAADQLVSVYYLVHAEKEPDLSPKAEERWNKRYEMHAGWHPLSELKPGDFYFPVDRKVCELLEIKFNKI